MKFKYDGKSRPVNETYTKRWFEIFGKKEEEELKESYEQSKLNKQERIFGENQDDVKHDHVNKDRANKKDTNENKN